MAKMATGTKVAIGVGVTGVGAFLLWKFWLKDKLGGGDGDQQATQDIGPGNTTVPTQTWDPSTNWGTPEPEIPPDPKRDTKKDTKKDTNTYRKVPNSSTPVATAQRGDGGATMTVGGWKLRRLTDAEVARHQAAPDLQDITSQAAAKFPKVAKALTAKFGSGWAVYRRTNVPNVYFIGVMGRWYRAAA